jgi:hypothetical protein
MWRGFTEESFKLLDKYKANDDTDNYNKEEFDLLIRDQFKAIKESKTKDIQLFWRIDPDRFSFGLYVGHEMDNQIFKDIQKNISKNHLEILKFVSSIKSSRELTYANPTTIS